MFDLGLWARLCPALLCVGLGLSGCKDDHATESDAGSGACEDGEEGCACYGNGTCNEGLDCLSKHCVDRDENPDELPIGADAAIGPAADASDDAADAPAEDDAPDEGDNAGTNDAGEPSADDPTGDEPAGNSDDSSDEPAADEPSADDMNSDDGEPNLDASVGTDDDAPTEEPSRDASSSDDPSEPATDEPVSDDSTGDAMTDDATDPPPPPGELIKNGSFSSGTEYWNIEVPSAEADTSSGALCLRSPNDEYIYGPVGWPLDPLDAFALQAGRRYRLEFDAWVFDQVGLSSEYINAKVGEAIPPYGAIFTWDPQVTGERGTYAAEFVAEADYPQVGVVFLVESNVIEMCFDNVSLVTLDEE